MLGRRIWILSDEPYRRIRFDGVGFVSPAACYPWTLIDYSYGKVLLAPGQRLGYLALSPLLPDAQREALREAFFPTQMALGWGFPDALMQYAVPDLEHVSIDLAELARRRDRMVGGAGGVRVPPDAAGGHVLPLGRRAGRGRARLRGGARGPRRAGHARDALRLAGALPHLPDRHDGDARAGAARLRGGGSVAGGPGGP